MKRLLSVILFSLITSFVYSQARMVINNNGFIVIDNSAFLVLDNGAANTLSVAGTGGNIISEAEDDVIKWNVGTATGVHTIPWSTSVVTGAVKIPLSINITGAGVGAGNILLSTHETPTDNNTPWQSGISNMCSSVTLVDGTLLVADRFWQINANGYGTKPGVTMNIGYNPAANEIGGTNGIVEANLQAQRFNPGAAAANACFTGAGSWETLIFGTNNAASDNVNNIVVAPADFFKDWILTDNSSPLPVELISFKAICENSNSVITWSTAAEINNDFFVIEKSYDATVFFELATVIGAGNSNVINTYSVIDNEISSSTTYYRLKQVDFDGTTEYHETIATNCDDSDFDVTNFVMEENQLGFNVTTSTDETLNVFLYDYRGRLITNTIEQVSEGRNTIQLTRLDLSTGIYMLSIIGETNTFSTKLMKR
jgi:hypothetical protein